MYRRNFLRALAAFSLPGGLVACGGGSSAGNGPSTPRIDSFTSDKNSYAVGESASLRAVYAGTSARIEPGAMPVTSGMPVTVGPLRAATTYRLIVSHPQGELTRELTVAAAHRNIFTPLAMGFARAAHTAVAGSDGRVFILGGEGSGGAAPVAVMAFDSRTETFAAAGELLSGRTQHTSTLLADGTILVFGGSRTTGGAPIAERFDPRTGVSRATLTQPLANRLLHSATLLADGRVLLAGGLGTGQIDATRTIDIFDPQTEQFSRAEFLLPVGRYGHAAVLATSNLLVLYGGAARSGQPAAPEVIDLQGQSATALALPVYDAQPRLYAAAVTAFDGDTFIIGGEDYTDGIPSAKITGIGTGGLALRAMAPLQTPRSRHAAAALYDGRVLITGGTATAVTTALASTEFFAPAAPAADAGPALAIARTNHTATTLANGKVLVVGGNDAARGVIATAEIYN